MRYDCTPLETELNQVSHPTGDLKPLASTLLIAIAVHLLILVNWNASWMLSSPNQQSTEGHNWISLNLTPAQNIKEVASKQKTPSPSPASPETRQPEPTVNESAKKELVAPTDDRKEMDLTTERIVENEIANKQNDSASDISSPAPAVEDTQKNIRYMQLLLAKIEQHKYYPRIALRRGVTGDVAVVLSLDDKGHIIQLDAASQHTSLSNATRRAIESAQPLPLPDKHLLFPMQLEFSISYKII